MYKLTARGRYGQHRDGQTNSSFQWCCFEADIPKEGLIKCITGVVTTTTTTTTTTRAAKFRLHVSCSRALFTWQGEVQSVDEGALGWFHLRTGVVKSLAAPHNRTQGFLQGTVQFRLIQPGKTQTAHAINTGILHVRSSDTSNRYINRRLFLTLTDHDSSHLIRDVTQQLSEEMRLRGQQVFGQRCIPECFSGNDR